jgi:hypothetical protein
VRSLSLAVVLLAGCNVLFPELNPMPSADLAPAGDGGASGDGGAAPRIEGQACLLTDVTTLASCQPGSSARELRVSVEETRDLVQTDVNGRFSLPTARALELATLAVVDTSGTYVPAIVTVRPTAGVVTGLLVPLVRADTLALAAQRAGASLDPQRGALLAWALDKNGQPIPQTLARLAPGTAGAGPLHDGGPNDLEPLARTGPRGALAFFDLRAGSATVALTPPAGFTADQFVLPIRGGALTLSALLLR